MALLNINAEDQVISDDQGSNFSTTSLDRCSHLSHDKRYYHSQSRQRKARCHNKNAVSARENRLKKKEYVMHLEKENFLLRRENESLKANLHMKTVELETVRKEVSYLRNVITNRTSIKTLLSSLNEIIKNKKTVEPEKLMESPSNLCRMNYYSSEFIDDDPFLSSFNASDGISFSDPDEESPSSDFNVVGENNLPKWCKYRFNPASNMTHKWIKVGEAVKV